MSTRPSNFLRSAWANRGRPCTVRGCSKTRHGVGQFCSRHTERKRLYGHVEGRSIRLAEIEKHYKVTKQIIRETKDQAAMREALAIIDGIMFSPGEPPSNHKSPEYMAYDEQRRMMLAMQRQEVSIEEASARVFGVWFLSATNERALPDDDRLTYALARIVLGAVERPVSSSFWDDDNKRVVKDWKDIPTGALHILGTRLRRKLARFWSSEMLPALTKRSKEMLTDAKTTQEIIRNPLVVDPWKTVKKPRASHHVKPIAPPGSRLAQAMEKENARTNYVKLTPITVHNHEEERPQEEPVTDAELHAVARELKLDLNYPIGQTRAREEVLARRQRQKGPLH